MIVGDGDCDLTPDMLDEAQVHTVLGRTTRGGKIKEIPELMRTVLWPGDDAEIDALCELGELSAERWVALQEPDKLGIVVTDTRPFQTYSGPVLARPRRPTPANQQAHHRGPTPHAQHPRQHGRQRIRMTEVSTRNECATQQLQSVAMTSVLMAFSICICPWAAAAAAASARDLARARQHTPGGDLVGIGHVGMTKKLNTALRGMAGVKDCDAFSIEQLVALQRLLYAARDPALEAKCHEAVMWFVHHVPQATQAELGKMLTLPLLPERERHEPSNAPSNVTARFDRLGCDAVHAKGAQAKNHEH
eukprot:gene6148-51382_t